MTVSLRWAARLLLVAGLICATLLALLVVRQRSFLYHPEARGYPPAVAGVAIQPIALRTADGETLVVWWLPPRAGRPTLLFFDGNAVSLRSQSGRWTRIAAEGVGFLAVAYRGYSGSTGRPSEAGLHRDAEATYAWLVARVPARDIVIHGFSLGSGVAVRLAAEHPCRTLILEAPYTSIGDVMAAHVALLGPLRFLVWDRFDSRRWIGHVRAPILIVHGDHDSVIPYALGRALYAAAPSPKQFVRFPGSDHATLVRDGLYPVMWRFLGLSTAPKAVIPAKASPSGVTLGVWLTPPRRPG